MDAQDAQAAPSLVLEECPENEKHAGYEANQWCPTDGGCFVREQITPVLAIGATCIDADEGMDLPARGSGFASSIMSWDAQSPIR